MCNVAGSSADGTSSYLISELVLVECVSEWNVIHHVIRTICSSNVEFRNI